MVRVANRPGGYVGHGLISPFMKLDRDGDTDVDSECSRADDVHHGGGWQMPGDLDLDTRARKDLESRVIQQVRKTIRRSFRRRSPANRLASSAKGR